MRGVNIARIKMFGVQPHKHVPPYLVYCCVISAGYLCVNIEHNYRIAQCSEVLHTQPELSGCHLLNMREKLSTELIYPLSAAHFYIITRKEDKKAFLSSHKRKTVKQK